MKKSKYFFMFLLLLLFGWYLYRSYLYPDIMVSSDGIVWQNGNTDVLIPVEVRFEGKYAHSRSAGRYIEGELKLESEDFNFNDTIILYHDTSWNNWVFRSKFIDGRFVYNPNVSSSYSLGRPYAIWGERDFSNATITFYADNNTSWNGNDAFILSYPANTREQAVQLANTFKPIEWNDWT